MKVALWPTPEEIESNHGIGRIVHAQFRYLPEHDIQFVGDPGLADVIASHTQQFDFPDLDVLHTHGIYWTGDPGSGRYEKWHHFANLKIVEAARRARLITVPSQWVLQPFLRDMRVAPLVIGHGLDLAEWEIGEPRGYVLWNKNRNLDVCDPTPAVELARRGARVVSTFAPIGVTPPDGMTVVGMLPHEKMKRLIQGASIYLATVKETYGIGTLEAMACGIPILGFRYGGTADIVEHGVTGYLAKPGDYDELWTGLEYIQAHRAEMSGLAREAAQQRDWSRVIGQYAEVYRKALALKQNDNTLVSVIITNHNYGRYIQGAIQSALDQTFPCEIMVVDDGSTDDSRKRIDELAQRHPDRIRPIFQANAGVAAARNVGIRESAGEYLVCLDADDRLDSRYTEFLRDAFLGDRALGVAYTGLGLLNDDGMIEPNPGWPPDFDWRGQSAGGVPPSNAIPCAAMFRKSMWRRAGGYRQEYAPGEDAEFFTRGLSVGFTARKVTDDYLFHYRVHPESASRTKQYVAIDPFLPWIRDGQYPMAVPLERSVPYIRSYSTPKVSVVIPVGTGHEQYLNRALDSLLGQTLREWEAIVVDAGWGDKVYEAIHETYPFVILNRLGDSSSGRARNDGIDQAHAPLVLFLDADDWLMPTALEKMCRAYQQSGGRYIYTDWIAVVSGKTSIEPVPDYDPYAVLSAPQHAITVLMATEDARRIRFDEKLDVLEDWDFFARCAIEGIQGQRLAQPLIAVRIHSDRKTARWADGPQKDELLASMLGRYAEYREGGKTMGSCCGGNSDALMAAKIAAGFAPFVENNEPPVGSVPPEVVRVEFIGTTQGAATYGGPGLTPSGRRYRAGNNPLDRFHDADPRDVFWLENLGLFRRVVQVSEAKTSQPQLDQVLTLLERSTTEAVPQEPVSEPEGEAEVEIPEGGVVLTKKKKRK